MILDRRELLKNAGLLIASTGTLALNAEAAAKPSRESSVDEWSEFRKQFSLDPSVIHMTGLLLASTPKPVAEAIERHRKKLDKNPVDAFHTLGNPMQDKAREAAAKYLQITPAEIALTDSTTMGLGLLYAGIRLREGQEILTSTHDHYSTHESLKFRTLRTGTAVKKISLYEPGETPVVEEVVKRIASAIRPNTRVVALTWVHSSTGVKLPIKAISEKIEEVNRSRDEKDRVLFCVDGVHGFGVENSTMKDLGCDFFSAGCHKWMFGPRGTGILVGRSTVSDQVDPTIPSFGPDKTWGGRLTPGGFHSFEQRWALSEAFDLHQRLGKAKVTSRIHALNSQLKEGLLKIKGVRLHTPLSPELSAGLTCFEREGMKPAEIVERFAQKGIVASTTPYEVSYARLTPGLLNTPADVDKAIAALRSFYSR